MDRSGALVKWDLGSGYRVALDCQTEPFEETPEIFAAIEEGIRSADTEPGFTIQMGSNQFEVIGS